MEGINHGVAGHEDLTLRLLVQEVLLAEGRGGEVVGGITFFGLYLFLHAGNLIKLFYSLDDLSLGVVVIVEDVLQLFKKNIGLRQRVVSSHVYGESTSYRQWTTGGIGIPAWQSRCGSRYG